MSPAKNFFTQLARLVKKNNSLLCVGLDSHLETLRKKFKLNNQWQFNKKIIEATCQAVCAYKINTAFYEAEGEKGIKALKKTTDYLKQKYPEIPFIIDGKRGDIANTNEGYKKFIFDYLKADGTTVNPYLGKEALLPFLNLKAKGIFIICKTSNPGAGEFQDLKVCIDKKEKKNKTLLFYQLIAKKVAMEWNQNKNCALVVGATYPQSLKELRKIVGEDICFLVPGVGEQGGELRAVLKGGLNTKKEGLIINLSRSIIFSPNPKRAAEEWKNMINRHR